MCRDKHCSKKVLAEILLWVKEYASPDMQPENDFGGGGLTFWRYLHLICSYFSTDLGFYNSKAFIGGFEPRKLPLK